MMNAEQGKWLKKVSFERPHKCAQPVSFKPYPFAASRLVGPGSVWRCDCGVTWIYSPTDDRGTTFYGWVLKKDET